MAPVNFISSSSSLPNEVAFRPKNIDLPFSSLTLTKTKKEISFLFKINVLT
jgi:hypothetical protein